MIASGFLIVPDARDCLQPIGMPRSGLRNLIICNVAGARLDQRQRHAVLVHVGDQGVGVVDRLFRQAAVVQLRIARPKCDQVFRGLDVLAQVSVRREAPDMRVRVDNHAQVLMGSIPQST